MSSVSVEAAARGWFSAPDERALVIVADGQARALPPPSPRHACRLYHARRLVSAADSQPDCGERGAEGGVGRSTQGGRGARFGRQAHAQARAQHAAGVRDAGEEARGGASQGGGHGRLHERHETHRARDGLPLVVESSLSPALDDTDACVMVEERPPAVCVLTSYAPLGYVTCRYFRPVIKEPVAGHLAKRLGFPYSDFFLSSLQ